MADDQTQPTHEQTNKVLSIPAKFRLRFTMNSDWHIGSGTGRPGNIDSLVQRDADGLPYLPAKTVTGIWRDAAEQLAYGLDDGGANYWAKLVELIFGNQPTLENAPVDKAPNRSLLKSSSANYSLNLREHIKKRIIEIAKSEAETKADEEERKRELKSCSQQLARQLRTASVFVKPGVSIDPMTGQAKTDFLRFEEMGRKSSVLEAECVFAFDSLKDQSKPYAFALLLASVRLVERIGGKRRRGAGRCQMEIIKAQNDDELSSSDDAINWLEKNANQLNLSEEKEDSNHVEAFSFSAAADNDEWWTVPLVLKLKTPLAVTARTLGNISETLDYLPGTYLLPRITQVFTEIGCDGRAAIARGDVQVLPATIEVRGKRGLPVPHALFRLKSGGGFDKPNTVFNRQTEAAGKEQLKGYREGYIGAYQRNQLPTYQTTLKSLGTHNTVEDKAQRPEEVVGGVYSWEAIAAGTVLRSELRVRGDVKAALDQKQSDWWVKLNSDELRLGSSRKDDYGSVTLEVEQAEKLFSTTQTKGETLTVWLLSDVLLREPSLRATTFVQRLRKILGDKLKVTLDEHEPNEGLLGPLVRARRVESWQVSWGLPRPSLLAMQAGSCIVFKTKNTLDETKRKQFEDGLQKLECEGIGERRAEGYGQVRFNDPLTTEKVSTWSAAKKIKDEDVTLPLTKMLTSDEEKIARHFEKEIWREEMRRSILAFAADPENRAKELGWTSKNRESKPPSTQLGGLRDVVSSLRSETDKYAVTAWFSRLRATTNRAEKWKDGALGKVENLINDPNEVWKLIGWVESDERNTPKLTLTTNAEERLKTELWPEAVRGLVDACVRAHKRDAEYTRD